MPANLNALIRYKTINSCLYGGRRRWSISELREACSEALTEARGRKKGISVRTLRDDLRIMRSDILGFNAPIEQEKGHYYYSDPEYSILSLKITDAGLANKIFIFLIGLRTKIQHPELENILEQLASLTGKVYERPVVKRKKKIFVLPSEDNKYIQQLAKNMQSYSEGDQIRSEEQYFSVSSRNVSISESLMEKLNVIDFNITEPKDHTGLSWGLILEKVLV
jgi:hypothetical protein